MADHQQIASGYDMSGRVALIPGGLGGAGQAVIRAFLEAGAEVVTVGHAPASESDTFRKQLGKLAARFSIHQSDVTNEVEVQSLIQSVVERYHKLDILVNLVGGWAAGQPVTDLELSTWERMLTVNLTTAFLLSKHAARPMIQQNWGRIIQVSSRGARSGRRNAAAYAVAKNAVLALVEIQAEELRDTNITVNAILPSIIDTAANRVSMPTSDFSRWPKGEEVAHVLLFLASDDAQLISGASIPVYGRA
jgi:NAD(P)-dependent dehydrogenase (short-subunit alcohol dehydrogenase family)